MSKVESWRGKSKDERLGSKAKKFNYSGEVEGREV